MSREVLAKTETVKKKPGRPKKEKEPSMNEIEKLANEMKEKSRQTKVIKLKRKELTKGQITNFTTISDEIINIVNDNSHGIECDMKDELKRWRDDILKHGLVERNKDITIVKEIKNKISYTIRQYNSFRGERGIDKINRLELLLNTVDLL